MSDFRITFRPLASSIPAPVRLKHLLKFAGRVLALRCVSAEEISPEDKAAAIDPPGTMDAEPIEGH